MAATSSGSNLHMAPRGNTLRTEVSIPEFCNQIKIVFGTSMVLFRWGTSFLTKFLSCPLLLSVIESQEKGGANMDFSLMDDLNHFFDVFNTRTENSLKRICLPSRPILRPRLFRRK